MKELFEAAVAAQNVIPTALMGLVLLYWLTVVVGALDFDSLDFDIETDMDSDIDIDIDLDTGVDGDVGLSWFNSVLVFFNVSKVPFMLFFTALALPIWVISILVNHYLGISSFIGGLLTLIPAFIVGLFIAKIITFPFVKLFEHLEKDDKESGSAIGKICVASTSITSEKVGQATVKTSGSPLLLNVVTHSGTVLKNGETALVIDYLKDRNIYLVEPYNSI